MNFLSVKKALPLVVSVVLIQSTGAWASEPDGEESGMAPFGGCSLVAAPYGVDGKVLGVLGVIGPTRMAYERVIPMVQTTAQVLTAALNQAQQSQ